ncbi:ras-specific guanine nucleotide-releasing factor 1 [Planoprotostelium fungivorum]|uniref:Ras-specific guanine nucleotide-releasing factor 1 n=1 Tax=Planoprotostelium fungivorum TaxID=1890364 RepID=A0A2P6N7K9_9EUKA|nr:ras-specific guanine nucleotide-releasing factor 1 [Planoprotostelium fungivorum]
MSFFGFKRSTDRKSAASTPNTSSPPSPATTPRPSLIGATPPALIANLNGLANSGSESPRSDDSDSDRTRRTEEEKKLRKAMKKQQRRELELKLGEHLDELLAANELLSEENARLTAELEVERARSKRWEDMYITLASSATGEDERPERKLKRISVTLRPRRKDSEESVGSSSDAEVEKAEKKRNSVSLESMAKADLLKEQLGNKYSNFAKLRRTQMETMSTRKAKTITSNSPSMTASPNLSSSPSKHSRSKSINPGERNLAGSIGVKKNEELSNFLVSRKARQQLMEQGILYSSVLGALPETLLEDGRLPTFFTKSLTFLLSKGTQTPKLFVELLPFEEEQKRLESGSLADDDSPTVVASFLIAFFQQWQDPLLTFKLHNDFLLWSEIEKLEEKRNAARSLVFSLPPSHRYFLKSFIEFLRNYIAATKVPRETISQIFGPIWLRGAAAINSAGEDYLKQIESNVQKPDATKVGSQLVLFFMEEEEVFEEETEVEYVMKDGNHIVSAASMNAIMIKLLDPFYSRLDESFTDTVLYAHSYFTDAETLLGKLLEGLQRPMVNSWDKAVQTRAMRVLRNWIGSSSAILAGNKKFMEIFKQYASTQANDIFFQKFLSIAAEAESSSTKVELPVSTEKGASRELDIDDHEPTIVALQMTLLDHSLLQNIKSQEFLHKAFEKPERSPQFTAMAQQWNTTTAWVYSEILRRDKLQRRANVLMHFIKIADVLRTLQNYNSAYAIVVALNHYTISRLEKTWERVSRKSMSTFDNLSRLFEMSSNYKSYRMQLTCSDPPLIPYIGLWPKDITSVEEIPTITSEGHINISKLRNLCRFITQMKTYQGTKYRIDQSPDLYAYLKNPKIFNEKQARDLSEQYEPPKKRSSSVMSDTSPSISRVSSHIERTESEESVGTPRSSSRDNFNGVRPDMSDSESEEPDYQSSTDDEEIVHHAQSEYVSDSDNDTTVTTPRRASRNNRSMSMSDDDLSKLKVLSGNNSLTAKDKALLLKEMIGQKYSSPANLRREQRQKVSAPRAKPVVYRGHSAFTHAIEELSDSSANED